ncbi:MAG: phosphoglucosamine mutase [Phycisphaerales bacterium]|nr:phosphoglucosamine mutase [Phycisphaerales bacterium]
MSDHDTNEAPLMLTISGARGIVGASMTPEVAHRLAATWGDYLASTTDGSPVVVLGRDSRPSGPELSEAAARGLQDAGCQVVSLGIVTTPTTGVMIGALRAVGGVMITASHNPSPWNGLKLLDGRGTAPPADVASGIIERYRSEEPTPRSATPADRREDARGHDTHVAKVLGQVDPMPIRERGFRVVLDSVNGAGGPAGRMLLEALGCEIVHLHGEPTGNFAHPPEPRKDHLGELCQVVVDSGADIGFAQDPDADRLAIVDDGGRYIGEEYTLALAARTILGREPGQSAAANLSTSRLIDDVAAGFGATVHRSPVGEANVAEVMRAQDAIIGGEGNGGVMLPAVTWVRDSLSAMALVLELLVSEGCSLSGIVDRMPRYAMLKQTIELDGQDASVRLHRGIEAVAEAYRQRDEATVQTGDGVRVDLPTGWFHLRASNTEPIARLIIESDDEATAQQLASEARAIADL